MQQLPIVLVRCSIGTRCYPARVSWGSCVTAWNYGHLPLAERTVRRRLHRNTQPSLPDSVPRFIRSTSSSRENPAHLGRPKFVQPVIRLRLDPCNALQQACTQQHNSQTQLNCMSNDVSPAQHVTAQVSQHVTREIGSQGHILRQACHPRSHLQRYRLAKRGRCKQTARGPMMPAVGTHLCDTMHLCPCIASHMQSTPPSTAMGDHGLEHQHTPARPCIVYTCTRPRASQ